MSTGNDASAAETAQSDQPFLQQQQQQHCQQQHQQLQQQSHCQRSNSNSNNNNNNNKIMWMPANNTEAELNNGYWQQQQQLQQNNPYSNHYQPQQQYQQQQQQHKTFLMPEDIPPPPPQPKLKNGVVKRLQCERKQQQQQQQPQQRKQQQQLQHQHLTNCSFEQHAYDIQQQQQPQQQHHHHQYVQHQQQPIKQQKQQQQPLAHCQQHNHLQLQQQQQHQQQQQIHEQPAAVHHHPQQQQQQPAHFQHCLLRNQQLQQQQQQQQQYPLKYHSNLALKGQQQNLVYDQKKIRKQRIILGVIFAIVVVGLLATALVFILKDNDSGTVRPGTGNGGIKLEDVLTGHLLARHKNATWSTEANLLYRENNSIVEYDVKTGNRKVLMYDERQQYGISEKSADGQYLFLAKNYKKNFRHSFVAQYDIYNIATSQIQPLLIGGEQGFFSLVQWAPIGSGLIINFDRNLYYKINPLAVDTVQLTNDENIAILNGIPDWVYEEEVFSSNSAVWFNPNGTQIAFIRFDDSPTHVINFPYYGEAGDLVYQYPFSRNVAYPKAGSSNPHVKLFTANLTRAVQGLEYLTEIPVPSPLNTETDFIITVVEWLDNEEVLSVWMNRIQNLAYLQVFDGLRRYLIYSMESKTGWVDLVSSPFKNSDGSQIALILPQPVDGNNYYRHLSIISTRTSNGKPEALTKGKFEVDAVQYWDPKSDIIFYTANTVDNSEVMHLYAIKAATGQSSKCLTCTDQMSGDTKQTYFSADFNSDHQIIISSFGPGIPTTAIYEWKWSNNEVSITKLMDWESNTRLRADIAKIAMPQTEIHNIPIANGFTARALVQLPPNIDRSGKTKYPMLVDVYGGPSANSVTSKWTMDWGTYLSSNQSVIYVKIDGRGSGLRGENLLHSIYKKLGTVEIADQIEVTRELQKKFAFIDANHTGIWGWSYGGYAAAMALANDEDGSVFKCAASIAPVTDWAYYDSIYTERYMGLPKDNVDGYANSRLSTRALKLRGKKYLLVHGTLDDNVHYQQAMILAKNLERHDILFKQISYPDEDHALANVRPHLYHSLDRFFGECFASKRLMGATNK